MRRWLLLVAVLAAGCSGGRRPEPVPTPPAVVDLPGVHNVLRLNDRLYSGSSPEGDGGFQSLQGLGVRTIITVDGARPEVERARKHGMRYVHLPIGYDGVPRSQAL